MYLAVLTGCLVFYYAYREWYGWFTLVLLLCLPFFSLLISLPAMLTVRLRLSVPEEVSVGTQVTAEPLPICALPAPPLRCKLLVRHGITGETFPWKSGQALPTDHCGTLYLEPTRARVYDYLGLLGWRLGKKEIFTIQVFPNAVPVSDLPRAQQYVARVWKPKPGGGFAENYDLRQYRPGDDLHQIHWKLAAKTGDLIVREPIEPLRGKVVLSLVLPGTREKLDQDLGQLLWVSLYLSEKRLTHEIHCLTGDGLRQFTVSDREDTRFALRAILSAPAAAPDATLPEPTDTAWHCRIGGAYET